MPVHDPSLSPTSVYLVGSSWHLFIGVTPTIGDEGVWWSGSDDDYAMWQAVRALNRTVSNTLLAKVARPSMGGAGVAEELTLAEVQSTWVQDAIAALPAANKEAQRDSLGHDSDSYYRYYRKLDLAYAELEREIVNAMLEHWHDWATRPPELVPTNVAIRGGWGGTRRAWVLNELKAKVGYYELPDGPLVMFDEHARALAITALAKKGIDVTPGLNPDDYVGYAPALLDRTRNGEPARILMSPLTRFGTKHGLAHPDSAVVGAYDQLSATLTAYDPRFLIPLTSLIHRYGYPVAEAVTARPEYATGELFQRSYSAILESGDPVQALTQGAQSFSHQEVDQDFLTEHYRSFADGLKKPESSIYERGWVEELFGVPLSHISQKADMPEVGRCRLCIGAAYVLPDDIQYCATCCSRALGGQRAVEGTEKEEAALNALRTLAKIEFGGPPSRAQLRRVTAHDPATRDELMRLRHLVPSGGVAAGPGRPPGRTWTEWLALAGLLEDGQRSPRGTTSIATDGHLCRSLLERHIDDFLHKHQVMHALEPDWPYDPELNPSGMRADWELSDGTLVEAWGFLGAEYQAKVHRKIALAAKLGIRLVEVTAEDLGRLPEVFADWL